MKWIMSVDFKFKSKDYYAIVRYRKRNNIETYLVRVMNRRLDSIMTSNGMNLIIKKNGEFSISENVSAPLQYSIISSIIDSIKSKERAGLLCLTND